MGYWAFNNKPQQTDEETEEKIFSLSLAQEAAWRIECLTGEGFEPLYAGMLATLHNWREAKALKEAGCPQRLVWELLR